MSGGPLGPPESGNTTTSALAPISFSRISVRYPDSRPIATTSAATPSAIPAIERSDTEETRREGRDFA